MMDDGLAVGADLQIALDAVAAGNCRFERGGRILDDALARVVQASMGYRSRGQPVEAGIATAGRHVSPKPPSPSTAASAGNTATPTVVRACRPLSPNTETIRSEAPFITLGPSTKAGSELMKPPSRTTCLILSRSPSAALACASTLIPQARAAFWPSSSDTPLPSLPLPTSLPPASRQI